MSYFFHSLFNYYYFYIFFFFDLFKNAISVAKENLSGDEKKIKDYNNNKQKLFGLLWVCVCVCFFLILQFFVSRENRVLSHARVERLLAIRL